MGILDFLASMKSGVQDNMAPVMEAKDSMRSSMADFFGDTKTVIDEGDGSERTVMDTEAFNKRMDNFAKQAASMSQFQAPNMQLMQTPSATMPMPMPQPQQQQINPYAPVNYGLQPGMSGQMTNQVNPQNMTMEEIMAMLRSAGY